MKSYLRISAILACFGPKCPERRIGEVLEEAAIPVSTGYKIIGDMISEGLLRRTERGYIALGSSAERLFYTPLRGDMPLRAGIGLTGARTPGMPRMAQLETDVLKMIATDRYRSAPPFVIGFANASDAHPWRQALERSLLHAAQAQSEIVARVIVRNAENDPDLQSAQLREMWQEGADICIISAASERHPGLEATIADLAGRGLPMVGVDRFCGDGETLVSLVTASDVTVGRISALWLAERLGGQGRVALLSGLESASPSKLRLEAALQTFSRFPGIELAAVDYTDWLADRGYAAIRGHLARGWMPDGVWCDSGLQGIGAINAFLDAGFQRGEIPPHTGGELNLMYKMAVQERIPLCGLDYPAAMGAASVQVALNVLFGRSVPRIVEADLQVVVTRGHETPSVRADIQAEKKVDWSSPDSHVHAAGRLRRRKASILRRSNKDAAVRSPVSVTRPGYSESVRRLVDIVTLVATEPISTAYQISQLLRLPKSSAYQTIDDLEFLSWLTRDVEGNLLIGSVPQSISLAARGFEFAGHLLPVLVRYLRDQTGETAFAASLGSELQIGIHLGGYNLNSERFKPFESVRVEADSPTPLDGSQLLRCAGARHEGRTKTRFMMLPLVQSSPGFAAAQLVLGFCWSGASTDEAPLREHLREVRKHLMADAAIVLA